MYNFILNIISITYFPFVCPFFTWYFIPLTFLYLLVHPGTGQAKGLIGCSVLIFCCKLKYTYLINNKYQQENYNNYVLLGAIFMSVINSI